MPIIKRSDTWSPGDGSSYRRYLRSKYLGYRALELPSLTSKESGLTWAGSFHSISTSLTEKPSETGSVVVSIKF